MNRSTHTVMSLELQAGGRWRLKSGQFAPLNNYLAPNIQNMHVTNVYSFITFHRELLQIHGTSCFTNQALWKQPRYISEKYWPRWIEAKWELYLACGKWLFVPVNPLPLPHQTLAETCCFQMVAKLPWLEKKHRASNRYEISSDLQRLPFWISLRTLWSDIAGKGGIACFCRQHIWVNYYATSMSGKDLKRSWQDMWFLSINYLLGWSLLT